MRQCLSAGTKITVQQHTDKTDCSVLSVDHHVIGAVNGLVKYD